MFVRPIAIILTSAALLATASDVNSPRDLSPRTVQDDLVLDFVRDWMTAHVDELRPAEQMTEGYQPPVTFDDDGNEATLNPADYVFGNWLGAFPWNETNSCGFKLQPGSVAAPLYADCEQALRQWGLQGYENHLGRVTQVAGSCVSAWEPNPMHVADGQRYRLYGDSIEEYTIQLMDDCRDGDYVSNYAHRTSDLEFGTLSVYQVDFPPDGWAAHDAMVSPIESEDEN